MEAAGGQEAGTGGQEDSGGCSVRLQLGGRQTDQVARSDHHLVPFRVEAGRRARGTRDEDCQEWFLVGAAVEPHGLGSQTDDQYAGFVGKRTHPSRGPPPRVRACIHDHAIALLLALLGAGTYGWPPGEDAPKELAT
ncbi:hypothetical protein ABZ341_09670 [Streptomyces sp. NPDC006173]|uniref:hypothetical protein n=1 Tax=unclassified Streptomyces TaxID=2593676 RepID=UPI0033CF263A